MSGGSREMKTAGQVPNREIGYNPYVAKSVYKDRSQESVVHFQVS